LRRLTLQDRNVDYRLNGLRAAADLHSTSTHRLTDTFKTRPNNDRHHWPSDDFFHTDDVDRRRAAAAAAAAFASAPAARYHFSPDRKWSSAAATRSREIDDVAAVGPRRVRQYRATKSATSLAVPGPSSVSSRRHAGRAPAAAAVHSRSSSASRFSLAFI